MIRNGKVWEKKCPSCKVKRPIEMFETNRRGKHRKRCKVCEHVKV